MKLALSILALTLLCGCVVAPGSYHRRGYYGPSYVSPPPSVIVVPRSYGYPHYRYRHWH